MMFLKVVGKDYQHIQEVIEVKRSDNTLEVTKPDAWGGHKSCMFVLGTVGFKTPEKTGTICLEAYLLNNEGKTIEIYRHIPAGGVNVPRGTNADSVVDIND
jgi:hypothetical protein